MLGGVTTRVMVEQTAAVDPTPLGRLAGHLADAELDDVNRALHVVLGL